MSRHGVVLWGPVLVGLCASHARGGEFCDDFSEERGQWTFRVPFCGPSYSYAEREGFLRLRVPSAAVAGGNFDNWTGADRAPTFERYDMGAGDWTITTRLAWDEVLGAPAGVHHAGLMFAFGRGDEANDVVYWGDYNDGVTLAVERTGNNIRPTYPFTGAPVSLQVAKQGSLYTFRHRADDVVDPWTDAVTLEMTAPRPVGRVGLVVKTWGGAAPEVVADFDYFCLDLPAGEPDEDDGDIEQLSPLSSLTCERDGDSLVVGWQGCDGATTPTTVSINGEVVATVDPDDREVVRDPPFPGGSIIHVEVDNSSGFPPLECTLAEPIATLCDEFDDDLDTAVWTFRTPVAGPTVSVEDNPGFLRFRTPTGNFDNWTGADRAPSLERYDMGANDWTIRTRLSWDEVFGVPAGEHHVGLMFAFGTAMQANDVVYWGEYQSATTLRVERTGSAQTGLIPYDGAPVSLQATKSGGTYAFSHRQNDTDPWILDATSTLTTNLPAPARPVARVGLLIKTWGSSPAVVADFDYFCLEIPDSPPVAAISATPSAGTVPFDVGFSASGSTDPSGGTLTFSWDFGDGAMGAGENVVHTYTTSGIHTVALTATDDENNSGTSTAEIVASDDPAPLTFSRLGDRGLDGGVFLDTGDPKNTVYSILAGGSSFGSRSDQAHFLHRRLAGDFVVSAKIESADLSAGVSARVGLMARADNGDESPMVLLSIEDGTDGYVFRRRDAVGRFASNESVTLDPPRAGLPVWLRLERQGARFTGFVSSDGASYTQYASVEVPNLDLAEVEVGVGATSGTTSARTLYVVSELEGLVPPPPPKGPLFHRGDADANGNLELTDGVFTLNYLFSGGPTPPCLEAADADDRGSVELTDGIVVLNYLFLGGVAPAPPGPPPLEPCGLDPEGSADVGCESYPPCAP